MGTLARLSDFETDRDATPPVLISATKMDAELDQLVTESNAQDVRLDAQEAAGNVSTADLADDAVDGDKIAANAVDSDHYVDGSIDLAHMSANSVDSDQYVDGSIDLAHMSANSVDSDQYVDGSIDAVHLSADCVVSATVENDSLVNADINSSAAIDATKIHNGSVTNTEFGYINTVTSNVQTQIDNIVAATVTDAQDDDFRICDDGDGTKKIAFQASGITSGNTRTITMADENIDLTPTTGSYAAAGSGMSAGFVIAMSIAL